MLALIKAKRDEHLANMEMVDARDQFEIITTKMKVNIYNVMNDVCSTHMHKNIACKNKKGTIVGELKKIYDYNVGTRLDANY